MALSSSLQDAGDGILAERAADGDARAFEVLVRRHAPYMRAFAIRLTGSRADADDAVQEALITAWDRLPTLEKPDRVKSWLLQIVSRKSIDRIRARRPVDDIDDHEIADRLTSPERDAETSSQMRALAGVLDTLPREQREVWMLREVGGFSYEEIAERLGATPSTVRGRLSRARTTVMTSMEAWR
ncbi:RNA polymerase sigma factor [Clavibacter michiganensis]|uniref:RNA polymerase sigma factor CnrH n=1 Tax=Clavibacter michiganensis TaxID=28447 RepID=A0A251YJK5_9MICO|nr:sigma-70 family RNA polymerase sigma factor [Clavibacter michiganensis]OUE24431.1 RNA polymerase sigma factor CnrH [Clavibacter michiganensis]